MGLNNLLIKATDFSSIFIHRLGIKKYWRALSDIRLVFFHGIGDGKAPCFRYLHDELPLDIFEYHIEYLMRNYTVLPLKKAIEETLNNPERSEPPICSISFDDGLRSVYTKAFPALKKRNLAATVFLNTPTIESSYMTWLHVINYLMCEFGSKKIAALFNQFKTEGLPLVPENEFDIQNWYKGHYEPNYENNLLGQVLDHLGLVLSEIAEQQKIYLNWEEISEMEKFGFIFSSHTQNHAPLACFTKECHLNGEITGAYETLRQHGKDLDFISLPFGMKVDYGEKATSCAFDAGHKYVLEVGDGINDFDSVKESKIFARVDLGNVEAKDSSLYSAIELRPKLKANIRGLLSSPSNASHHQATPVGT